MFQPAEFALARRRTHERGRRELMKYGHQFGVWRQAALADGLDGICFSEPIELEKQTNTSAPAEFCLR